MGRTYTTQIRLLLCQQCGAPLETAPTGGVVACGYCKAQNQIASRRDDGAAIAPPKSHPVPEPERIRRLRTQDGQPLVPPDSLRSLLMPDGSGFHPSKVDEAFHVYQAIRREVQATHSIDAMERLFMLTLIADRHLNQVGDHPRRRALLETSHDALTLPRHKQVLRCSLATASAKEGDLASAESWLQPCDPRSEDLQADTAFRVARAFVATVSGQYPNVIALLGSQDEGYPIHDAWDPVAAVLRANALERSGDVMGAVAALRARMARESHSGRVAMEKVREAHAELHLCAASFPMALQGHSEAAAEDAGRSADGGAGTIFFVVGIGVCLLGVVLTLAIGGSMALAGEYGGALFSAGIAAVTTFPLGLIFAALGYGMRKSAKKQAWLRVNGLRATGTITGHQRTGVSINDVPQVEVQIQVMHPQLAPYQTSTKMLLTGPLASQLVPGAQVPLRVHPQSPHEIAIELN